MILDRVLERGRLLRLNGPSVRTLHVNLDEPMKENSDQDADLVRISGKNPSEFPEPTALALRNRIDRVRGRRGDALRRAASVQGGSASGSGTGEPPAITVARVQTRSWRLVDFCAADAIARKYAT